MKAQTCTTDIIGFQNGHEDCFLGQVGDRIVTLAEVAITSLVQGHSRRSKVRLCEFRFLFLKD
jgi:hypothetical protein